MRLKDQTEEEWKEMHLLQLQIQMWLIQKIPFARRQLYLSSYEQGNYFLT